MGGSHNSHSTAQEKKEESTVLSGKRMRSYARNCSGLGIAEHHMKGGPAQNLGF